MLVSLRAIEMVHADIFLFLEGAPSPDLNERYVGIFPKLVIEDRFADFYLSDGFIFRTCFLQEGISFLKYLEDLIRNIKFPSRNLSLPLNDKP